jgi:hypothetical protein
MHNGHDYRREGNVWLVEIRLTRLEQLFNNLDPMPFQERDLDTNAATYILDCVQELPRNAPIKIRIYLPTADAALLQPLLGNTVARYFNYRARVNRQRLHDELHRGRISLLAGLLFLTLCIVLREMVQEMALTGSGVIEEGLIIMGWVAMWRPLEIFLYDWWPHLGRARLYERVARLPVEVAAMPIPDATDPK